MRVLLAILIGGLAAGCTMESEPVDRAAPTASAIAAATQGRVAGDPVACIDQRGLRNTRTVAGAIIFEGPGDVVYVNEGLGGCQALAHGRAIRTSNPIGRLCRGDIVTAFEPVSGMEFGGCAMGDFVPYRRVD